MSNNKEGNSAKKLRILRFSGVLVFVGTFIFALVYTGDDQFLKRCLANGNSVKYCNDIYDDRNLAFKDKQFEKEEKRRQRELKLSEKRKQRELELANQKTKELELANQRIKELELANQKIKELELAIQRRKKAESKSQNKAAKEEDLFLYKGMGASYLCIASKAGIDFQKAVGVASATYVQVLEGKHGGLIEELGDKKLDREKLFAGAEFQIVETAIKYCPESVPRSVKIKVNNIFNNK